MKKCKVWTPAEALVSNASSKSHDKRVPAMTSLKSLIGDTLGKLVFPELSVTSVRELVPGMRRVTLEGAHLRSASFTPGDKLQVLVAGMGTRTYTPFAVDATRGTLELLVYLHGDGPGAHWGRTLVVGDKVRVFGPRGSLPLPSLHGPVVLFGDETSFALGRALGDLHARQQDVTCVFEVGGVVASKAILADVGVPGAELVARSDEHGWAHLVDVETALRDALARRPGSWLVLTGKAQSIQVLRAAFKQRAAPYVGQKVKAYWSVGKRGLD